MNPKSEPKIIGKGAARIRQDAAEGSRSREEYLDQKKRTISLQACTQDCQIWQKGTSDAFETVIADGAGGFVHEFRGLRGFWGSGCQVLSSLCLWLISNLE